MKSIEINISTFQKVINFLKGITMTKGKVNSKTEAKAEEKQLFPNEASITTFQRKAYMGNFMAGPYAMIDPRFFKSKKPHFQNN
jgi:hypothetical protein